MTQFKPIDAVCIGCGVKLAMWESGAQEEVLCAECLCKPTPVTSVMLHHPPSLPPWGNDTSWMKAPERVKRGQPSPQRLRNYERSGTEALSRQTFCMHTCDEVQGGEQSSLHAVARSSRRSCGRAGCMRISTWHEHRRRAKTARPQNMAYSPRRRPEGGTSSLRRTGPVM